MKKIILFAIILLAVSFINCLAKEEPTIISHEVNSFFDLSTHQERLKSTTNLALPLEEELKILEQLNEFELGRDLLANKGANGYWAAYILIHGPKKQLDHPLENWLVNKAPVMVASQERFKIFQQQIAKYTAKGMTLASIPCGLMDDLLTTNYHGITDLSFVGVDLDSTTLELAEKNAIKHRHQSITTFIKRNAWQLEVNNKYDIITSHALNFYQKNDNKVTDLYKVFFKALKPGGILITSFITPSPISHPDSSWKNCSHEDILKQKAIFYDIVQANWQTRSEQKTREQLEKAGFKILDIIYDSKGIFPTVVAQKVSNRK